MSSSLGLATVVCLGGAGVILASVLASSKIGPAAPRKAIASPRATLIPSLTAAECNKLAYPPDILPGSRDVSTLYGCMRVYEWGPEAGRKVIMVHGDATPAPLFSQIARGLVDRGCRVMLFDLWGRGYSDTPVMTPHDSRLYALQIHFAIYSSPIAWTGKNSGGFSIIGFSMGGSITMDFFAHHSHLVNSLILLGPGGLLRDLPSEYKSIWYRRPALVTKTYMRKLIASLLGTEVKAAPLASPEGFTPATALQWQFDNHEGHVESFLSTIQYGPLQHQNAIWEKGCAIIRGDGEADLSCAQAHTPLRGGKILVVCGASDAVVPAKDVCEDLEMLLGQSHFESRTVPGGHGFPWQEGKAVLDLISDFWNLDKD